MPALAQVRCGVNLGALDSMVTSYMAYEGLAEDGGPPESSSIMKAKCENVRRLIHDGALLQAKKCIEDISPPVLKDTRLEFRLKRQVFVEHLRAGGMEADKVALDWVRHHLAPLAMDAYAEAYNEFRKTLLMFLYDSKSSDSPVSKQWSIESRENLGDVVFSTLRKATGFKDPDLVNLLKYLLVIRKQHHAQLSSTPPEPELSPRLSIKKDFPGPLPEERPGSFPEKDVQAIINAVNIQRQEAIEALKHTNGDVAAAFENELGRIQIDTKELNKLVLEYAGYRGLLQVADQSNDEEESGTDGSMVQNEESGNEQTQSPPEEGGVDEGDNVLSKPPKNVQDYQCDPRLKKILRLVRLVKDGKYVQAMENIQEIDAELFKKSPQIKFELWRFEVLRLAAAGSHDSALLLLRKKLTPIVSEHMDSPHQSHLVTALQETISLIMSTKPEMPSPTDLCSAIQTALQTSLDLPGPSLVLHLKSLLTDHREWFRKQHCQDIFAKNLGIDVLHQADNSTEGSAQGEGRGNRGAAPPAVEEGNADGSRPSEQMDTSDHSGDDSEIMNVNEEAILQIMEILNLPRGAAIDLLAQHDGNIQSAVENVVQ